MSGHVICPDRYFSGSIRYAINLYAERNRSIGSQHRHTAQQQIIATAVAKTNSGLAIGHESGSHKQQSIP